MNGYKDDMNNVLLLLRCINGDKMILIICLIVFLYTEELLILWLGKITTDGILLVKLVILAFPFYSIMGVLRGPIDAGSEKGYNSIIYVIAALGMLFSFLMFRIASVNIIQSDEDPNTTSVDIDFSLNYEPDRFESITLNLDGDSESTSTSGGGGY